MREPKVENKYNLTFSDLSKLIIYDRTKICEPLFWRNNIIKAWCISDIASQHGGFEVGVYNDYWIGIYDDISKRTNKIKVDCSACGGLFHYRFNKFFSKKDIEYEIDLEIQEKLLSKINELIDLGILALPS